MNNERISGPERVSNIPASRYSGIDRWAFCKEDAGEGSTLTCYLETDGTGPEVTVNFTLLGGISNLEDGHLSLVDGTPIRVAMRGGSWWCTTPIEGTVEKDCG